MKKMYFSFVLFVAASVNAQIKIDKPLELTGGTGERRVTGLELPTNGTDAASKDYVDNQLGGGIPHYVGEVYGGGLVCSVFKDVNGVEHGFAVSIVNNGHTVPYSNLDNTSIGNSGRSVWDGASNTTAILAQPGHTNSAAFICDQYNGGSYTDWFLPAPTQMVNMWTNLYPINKSLESVPGGEPLGQYYWTSAEANSSYAMAMNFQSGSVYQEYKGSSILLLQVRCIREF
ncbi:MAG: hypothetical protein IT223_01015 [Crocinitomicaceae bacterium]|nr:hypothetical protein [Crocinitomicaceae bacterium]